MRAFLLTLAKRPPRASLTTNTTKMSMDGIVGLNSKHLAKGSSPPSKLAPGCMRLYSMRFCPYVERVMIALHLKRIPFEIVNINLLEKPEWYLEMNPLGKVPSIQHDGKIIYESLVCVDYLDETFNSGRSVSPQDSYERAKQRMLVERLSTLGPALYSWSRDPSDQSAIVKVTDVLGLYEKLLHSDFFAGMHPGYTDYMMWPWVERLQAIEVLSEGVFTITQEKYPKLFAYIDRMRQLPEIAAFLLDGSKHAQFIRTRLEGKTNYDLFTE